MSIEDKTSLCKVLFIGPYRQPDGWGSFSRSIIASLLSIEKINLTTRPNLSIKLPAVFIGCLS